MKFPVAVVAVALLLGGCASSGGTAVDPDAVEALKEREARTGTSFSKSNSGVKTVDPTQLEQQRGGKTPAGVSGG